jgi:two-component system sensor histidine kinase/response regulator
MLKTTRDHLKQLAREKEELLGMISHYLQNNLAGMNMSARLLLDRTHANGDPKLRLMAENICASSNQMRVFIKALLANAAADRGFKISLESMDFSTAVMRSLRQYEDTARDKEIILSQLPLPESAFIYADPAALDQVLDNLISNAVKFSPPKKKITVAMRQRPGHVECHIRDEGPGFTEADKARMFQRYARLSARPTGGEPSTGLGLSIAKKLVQAMNGDLNCQSVPGHGATFILRLPISPRHS